MNTPLSHIVTALQSGFGLLLIWVLVYFGVREYRIDVFRQRLFALRDELFDYAADGGVPFDHPAYCRLRMLINSLIRFAHMVTFGRLFSSNLMDEPSFVDRPHVKLMRAINELPSEGARKKLQCIHYQVGALLIRHLLFGSPLMVPYMLWYAIPAVLRGNDLGPSAAATPVDRLEDEAILAEVEALDPAHAYC